MVRPTPEDFDRVLNDEDYVHNRRFGYSLAQLLERYPDGAPANVIAASFLIEESDIEPLYEEIVKELRAAMKVE